MRLVLGLKVSQWDVCLVIMRTWVRAPDSKCIKKIGWYMLIDSILGSLKQAGSVDLAEQWAYLSFVICFETESLHFHHFTFHRQTKPWVGWFSFADELCCEPWLDLSCSLIHPGPGAEPTALSKLVVWMLSLRHCHHGKKYAQCNLRRKI